MNCEEARTLIDAYLDGELELEKTLLFERHSSGCSRCTEELRALRTLRSKVRESAYFAAPAGLERKIRDSLGPVPGEAVPRAGGETRGWPVWAATFSSALLAAAVVLVLFLAVGGKSPLRGTSPEGLVSKEVLDNHLRSMLADHLVDVPSTDQHTVKPWFDGKLDFAPAVPDLSAAGFALAGGRLDYVADHPVAALVYRKRQHIVNLLCWPFPEESKPKLETDHGYNLIHWARGGMTYWVVSDLNAHELDEFATLIQKDTGSSSR